MAAAVVVLERLELYPLIKQARVYHRTLLALLSLVEAVAVAVVIAVGQRVLAVLAVAVMEEVQ
jgi:hypothetical protein